MNEFAQQVMEAIHTRIAADKTEEIPTEVRLQNAVKEEILQEVAKVASGQPSKVSIETMKEKLTTAEHITLFYKPTAAQMQSESFVEAVKAVIRDEEAFMYLTTVPYEEGKDTYGFFFAIPNPYYGVDFASDDLDEDVEVAIQALRDGLNKALAFAGKAYDIAAEEIRHISRVKSIKNGKTMPEVDIKGAAKSFLSKASKVFGAAAAKIQEQADKLSEEAKTE